MQIDPEFKTLIPPLSKDEYAILEESIKVTGIRDAVMVWDGIIVDGHNRFEIAEKHGLPCPSRDIRFTDRDAAKIWIIRNQFGRRNLTPYQRSELVLKLEPLIRERAKEKQSQGGKEKVVQKSAEPPVKTREELAKVAGVSHDTIMKVKKIQAAGTEEVKEKVRSGEMSINRAYQEIKKPPVAEYEEELDEEVIKDMRNENPIPLAERRDVYMETYKMQVNELFDLVLFRTREIKGKKIRSFIYSSLIEKLTALNDQLK